MMSSARTVVYFAYLGGDDIDDALFQRRLGFMQVQLQWLAELVAASEYPIEVLVPYVGPRAFDAEVHHAITRHGFRVDPASSLADRRNRYEYPGFRAMKTLADASAPNHLIYYCHSKGIMQLSPAKMGMFRLHTETGLTADLGSLTDDPAITRATLFPSKFGWCFYNFFWIKAGYMAGLTVEESDDRYHFEALIGDPNDREGYRGVLSLVDRLPFLDTGLEARPWYRASETDTPALAATYDRYAGMISLSDSANACRALADRQSRLPIEDLVPAASAGSRWWAKLWGK